VVIAAVRDLEPHQRARLDASELLVVPGDVDPDHLARSLDELRGRVGRVYLHVDVDALDTSEGLANQYAAPGGSSLDAYRAGIAVFARFAVAAAGITAWDPTFDVDGRVADAVRRLADDIAAHAPAGR